jgi:hypothetical protein
LQYILENPKNIKPSNYSENKVSVILPKSDIILLVSDSNHIIKYSKQISHLFELGRDESQFANLV